MTYTLKAFSTWKETKLNFYSFMSLFEALKTRKQVFPLYDISDFEGLPDIFFLLSCILFILGIIWTETVHWLSILSDFHSHTPQHLSTLLF